MPCIASHACVSHRRTLCTGWRPLNSCSCNAGEDELPVGRSRSQKDGSLTIFEARPRGWGEFSGPSRIVIRNGGKNPNEQNSYKRESGRKKS